MRDQHAVWEQIAESFDRSRQRTWPHVEEFLARIPAGRVLDLMCGNGRHTHVATARHHVVAVDWSRPLVRMVHERHEADAITADATRLPLADDAVDACIYVAGLHGIPTPLARAASLQELHRVLRPGGTAQVTVWSRDAPRFCELGTPGEVLDVDIPWRSDGHDASRHYHLYTADALRQACEEAGFQVLAQSAVAIVSRQEPDNLVIELRKDH